MTGYQEIKALLTPSMQFTTEQIAQEVKLSKGHVRRVLQWMARNKKGAKMIPGSVPHLWTGV